MNLLLRLHDPALPHSRLSLRQEITYMLVAVMEALWIAPWFAVFIPSAHSMPSYTLMLYVVGNILAALWLVRLLDAWGMWENLRQLLFLAGVALTVMLSVGTIFPPQYQELFLPLRNDAFAPIRQITFPPFLPVLVLVSFVWWRGLRLSMVPPTAVRVAFGIRLGILFFIGAALMPDAQQMVLAALPAFFFFGLLAVSMARAMSLREIWGEPLSFGPRWTGAMVLAAGAVTMGGFLIAAMLSGLDAEQINSVVQPLITLFLLAFVLLMLPIFLILEPILRALIEALSSFGPLENVLQVPDVSSAVEQGQQPDTGPLAQMMRQVEHLINQLGGLQTCVGVFIVLLVVAAVLLTLRRRQRASLPLDEEREDLESDALGGLRDMFRRGLGALNDALKSVGQFGLGRDLFAALTVRRVYTQMAALAARRGYPRTPSETPYEYQQTLAHAFPEGGAEVALITEAYVRVRYGEVPESAEALQAVVDAWQQLKASPAPP